jgi:RNA polymerase sigma factor (sigma-70 family)
MFEREFTEFYNLKFKIVFGFCFKRIGILEDTEEVVSKVFEAIYRLNPKDISEKQMGSLLFKIARNKINDWLREKYRLTKHFVVFSDDFEPNDIEVESRDNTKVKTILDDILKELNEKEMQLYTLKYIENQSISSISKILNQTENNTKVQTNRLVKKLKSIWTKMK